MHVYCNKQRHINVWAIAQCYVHDHALVLGEDNVRTISGWIRSRSLLKLATCSTLTDLSFARSAELVRCLLQIEAFFKKNESLKCGIDTEQVALSSFLKSEAQCRRTNRRLTHYLCDYPDRLSPEMHRMVERAREYISHVLGPFEIFFKSLPMHVRFSSGATATHNRKYSYAGRRLRRSASVTGSCWPYADALYSWASLPGNFRGRIVAWNRVLFVYKNFKTKRTIACESEGNSLFQLAFDSYAKRRLARNGQDLRCQERNQHEAYLGSLSGSIATEDFASASDTVALAPVAALFDPSWYRYLSGIRSGLGRLPDGTMVKYEKFSSMGNGSTFTIETLIFAACAYAVGSRKFQVYGDDVTLEAEYSHPFRVLTRFLGFTINSEKSYNTGFYRESCGKHYVSGIDVTPFFIRSLKRHKPNVCHILNGLLSRTVPGTQVFAFCRSLLLKFRSESWRLPVVPVTHDTCQGIHVSYPYARDGGYTKDHAGLILIKCLIPRSEESRTYHNHGSFWLWLLMKVQSADDGFEPVIGLDERTRATGRYRTRESVWYEPDGTLPRLTTAEFLLASLN